MALYDRIGKTYRSTRIPDLRIAQALLDGLGLEPGSAIADIGAGTGGYSNFLADQGYDVVCVEPSATMREQAEAHPRVTWQAGCAEQIPLADGSADGAISQLSLHHFQDRDRAFQEMDRVVGDGLLVFFTFDVRHCELFWLFDYFPVLKADALLLPPLEEVCDRLQATTGRTAKIRPFPLPPDLTDCFAAACWQRPERYLEPEIQAGISSFAKQGAGSIASGLQALAKDLETGLWEKRWGEVRDRSEFDGGYRIICA